MVEYTWPTDGAEIDSIMLLQLVHAIWRHIPSSLLECFTAPIKMCVIELEASLYCRQLIQDLDSGFGDFCTDTISWNGSYFEGLCT